MQGNVGRTDTTINTTAIGNRTTAPKPLPTTIITAPKAAPITKPTPTTNLERGECFPRVYDSSGDGSDQDRFAVTPQRVSQQPCKLRVPVRNLRDQDETKTKTKTLHDAKK